MVKPQDKTSAEFLQHIVDTLCDAGSAWQYVRSTAGALLSWASANAYQALAYLFFLAWACPSAVVAAYCARYSLQRAFGQKRPFFNVL